MTMVQSIKAALTTRSRTAREEMMALARRDAIGKPEADDDQRLADLLPGGGDLSEDDFNLWRDVYAQHAALKKAASMDKAGSALSAARKALKSHVAESEQLAKTRREQKISLEQTSNQAANVLRMAQKADAERELLEFQHPDLFGHTFFDDLDLITPRSPGDSMHHKDPKAREWVVTNDVYRRESHRRHDIMRAVRVEDMEANNRLAHSLTGERMFGGGHEFDQDAFDKQKQARTWVDIAKLPRAQRDNLASKGGE